jgi:putative DNA primase/helicase
LAEKNGALRVTVEKPPSTLLLCPVCGKPVKPIHKDDCGTQFYECEKCHEKTAKPMKKTYSPMLYEFQGQCDEEGRFNPAQFAHDLVNNYFFRTDKRTETIYIFNDQAGVWDPLGEIFIKQATLETLKLETRSHYYNDILFCVRAASYDDLKESPKIALDNGILNVETEEIEQPNPAEFIVTKLPVTYDKNADCPAIKKFLEEVFGEHQIPVVQELIGYCLYKRMPFHKAALLVGDGANGKSTFQELLKNFLGSENVSNVTLQELCGNRFASSQLYGKLANLCADLPHTAIASSGRFKMLAGGDTISAEFKHKPAFSFMNYAKMIFSANTIPQVSEDTLAFFRRWIILVCNNVFLGENCDPKMLEKLTTQQELSGLLNYALQGLKRLLSNGKFSINETVEELRNQYIRKSNPAKAFIEEKLEYVNDPKVYIEEAELYQKFILYCNSGNLPTMPKRSFTLNMQEFCPDAKQTTQRILGKSGIHVWQFIRLKESVATVATVASSLFTSNNSNLFLNINKSVATPATAATKPSVKEVLEKARLAFVEGTQEEWCSFVVEAGLSKEEAEALFQRLKGSEMFWHDRSDGKTVWRWA